ncbi:MAG TPA: HYR domain-containing protein [Pyrinomonadaceae bacterium]|nr:HYR domain-containing protein [Pyrinomonadaceae bacterium]
MTTPKFSKLLQLDGTQNNSRSDLKDSAKKQRAPSATRLAVLLTFLMIASAVFTAVSYSSSPISSGPTRARATLSNPKTQSANQRAINARKRNPVSNNSLLNNLTRPRTALSAPLPLESIATYAADCTTPQTDFDFTETICAVVSNANVGGRLVWGHTDGRLARDTMVDVNPKSDSLLINPTSVLAGETVDNKGTWKIETIDADGAPFAVAFFTIHDPATPTADLQVFKSPKAGSQANENTNVSFAITVANLGPDAAVDVHLADATPAAATFVSLTQDAGGPTFTCSGSDCTIASLARGASANFTAVYLTNGVASTTVTPYSASVSSDPADPEDATAELHPADNSASGELTITVTGAATDCTLNCPDNINAVANTTEDPGTGPVRGTHVSFTVEPEGDCGAVTATPASGSFFPVGSTTVNVTSATGGGSCSFIVLVEDTGTDPPTISCPSNKEVTANSNCEQTVTLGTPTTSGTNVTVVGSRSDGQPMYNCDIDGENCVRKATDLPFPAGVTTVTWIAYSHDTPGPYANNADEEAHRLGAASCTQTVTVNDVVAPTITIATPAPASADASCQAAIPDLTTVAQVDDNCACDSNTENCVGRITITVSQSPAPGTIVGLGAHTITLTANDGSSNNDGAGNTASVNTTFTVVDTTPPTITAPADSSAFADANCLAPVPDYRPGTVAADNCGSVTLSQSPAPGTLVGYGPHNVTVTADDGRGNTANDIVVFTVNDNTPPVFTSCPTNITREATCPTGAKATYATPTATDNCGVTVTRTTGPASGSVFPIGTTTVVHTADDGHGNTATCTFTVTVLTPQGVLQNLIASVNASSLTGTQKNGLLAKLNAALSAINNGQQNVACNKLSDFVNNVGTLISHGDITAAQGNAWISSANNVRNTIGCTNNPCT